MAMTRFHRRTIRGFRRRPVPGPHCLASGVPGPIQSRISEPTFLSTLLHSIALAFRHVGDRPAVVNLRSSRFKQRAYKYSTLLYFISTLLHPVRLYTVHQFPLFLNVLLPSRCRRFRWSDFPIFTNVSTESLRTHLDVTSFSQCFASRAWSFKSSDVTNLYQCFARVASHASAPTKNTCLCHGMSACRHAFGAKPCEP